MSFNIKEGIKSVKILYTLPYIRDELPFYINRIIIGFIMLIVLLFYGIKPNFNPWLILIQHFGLLSTVLIIYSLLCYTIFLTNKYKKTNYYILKIHNYLTNLCCDIIAVTISSSVLFIPTLIYGLFIGNFGMVSMILFIIWLIELLSKIKEGLQYSLSDNSNNFYFEANITCK